jgi:Putative beta-barrel porin 2
MLKLRLSMIAAGFFVWSVSASGQDLSLSRPGSLTFSHPGTETSEGVFTALPFKTSSYATVGYDDNVFTSHQNPVGSVYDEFGLGLDVNVGDQRTQLYSHGAAGIVAYWQRPGTKVDPNINFDLSLTRQFSDRTVVTLESVLSYQAQPNVASGIGALNQVADFLYSQNRFSFGYQWSKRFATFTNYSFNIINYNSSSIGNTEDRIEQTVSEEFRYLLRPNIVALVQYEFQDEDYLHYSVNDSHSHFFLGGADFTLSPRFTFSFRGGGELRYQQIGASEEHLYPYAEATFDYKFRPNSTIEWYNRYGLEESDLGAVGYRKTYRTGLNITWAVGARTTATAAVFYSNSEYYGPVSPIENDVELDLGATYLLTRKLSLNFGYTFTRDFSPIPSQAYVHNRVHIGLSYAF